MTEHDVTEFYDAMADDYHLIFADWVRSVERQRNELNHLVQKYLQRSSSEVRVLDCACGIGTQALGLAKEGYKVHATDISAMEVARAEREAEKMQVELTFGVADIRTLSQNIKQEFDVVLAFDNAIPHLLTDEELAQAAHELFAATRPGGVFMASIRDYDNLLDERPQITSQRVMQVDETKRVTFQLWEWG